MDGWWSSLKGKRRTGAKKHHSWLDEVYTKSSRIKCILPHCSQTGIIFLLIVLYFPCFKSLLSLCPPSQTLTLPNPLLSANSSKHLATFCTSTASLLPAKWSHPSIHPFILNKFIKYLFYWVAGTLKGNGDDKTQGSLSFCHQGDKNIDRLKHVFILL